MFKRRATDQALQRLGEAAEQVGLSDEVLDAAVGYIDTDNPGRTRRRSLGITAALHLMPYVDTPVVGQWQHVFWEESIFLPVIRKEAAERKLRRVVREAFVQEAETDEESSLGSSVLGALGVTGDSTEIKGDIVSQVPTGGTKDRVAAYDSLAGALVNFASGTIPSGESGIENGGRAI